MGPSTAGPPPPRPSGRESLPQGPEGKERSLIGTPFRLHGRSPDTGLDCIGVAAWVHELDVPTGYRLQTGDVARVENELCSLGFMPSEGVVGDVVLLRPGVGQVHLGIVTAGGFVHADAGLGRVVESPWRDDWPVLGYWTRGEG